MNMEQLQNFIIVAEVENMTKAADLLVLSQSALSRSILSLEKELGVPLFDRRNRKIFLNRHGKAFFTEAKKMQQQWNDAKRMLKEMISPESGNISASFVHSLGISYLPKIIKDFKRTFPDFTISLQEGKAPNIIKDLLTNAIDFGFGTQYKTFPELEYTMLFEDNIVLVVSKQHRFAKSDKPIAISDLTEEPFIQYTNGTELKKMIDASLESVNLSVNVIYDGLEINSILGFLQENEGIAFISESNVPAIAGIKAIPIENFQIKRPIYLIHKKQGFLSNAALEFKHYLLTYHDLA